MVNEEVKLFFDDMEKHFDVKHHIVCNNPKMLAYGNLNQSQMNRLGKKAFAQLFNLNSPYENLLSDIAAVFRNMGFINYTKFDDDKYYDDITAIDSDDEYGCFPYSQTIFGYRNLHFNLTINVKYNNCIYKVTFKYINDNELYITYCELVLSYDYLNSREQLFGKCIADNHVNAKIINYSKYYNSTEKEGIVQMEDGKFFYLLSIRYYINENNSFDSYYQKYSYEKYFYCYLDNKHVKNVTFEIEDLHKSLNIKRHTFNIYDLIKKSVERNKFNDKFDRYFF